MNQFCLCRDCHGTSVRNMSLQAVEEFLAAAHQQAVNQQFGEAALLLSQAAMALPSDTNVLLCRPYEHNIIESHGTHEQMKHRNRFSLDLGLAFGADCFALNAVLQNCKSAASFGQVMSVSSCTSKSAGVLQIISCQVLHIKRLGKL